MIVNTPATVADVDAAFSVTTKTRVGDIMPAWLLLLAKLLLPLLLQWLLEKRVSALPKQQRRAHLAKLRPRLAPFLKKGDMKGAAKELEKFCCELDDACPVPVQ